jgi:hypothetical protein
MSMIRKGRGGWVAKGMLLRKHGSSLSSSLSLPNFSLTFTTQPRLGSVAANFAMNPLGYMRSFDILLQKPKPNTKGAGCFTCICLVLRYDRKLIAVF